MKRFEDFTREDLWRLREEVCLNSLYPADYCNSFGIDAHSCSAFFDGFVSFIEEMMEEDGISDERFFDELDKYDNADNLESWYNCFEDFSWVQYEPEEDEGEETDWSLFRIAC